MSEDAQAILVSNQKSPELKSKISDNIMNVMQPSISAVIIVTSDIEDCYV